MRTRWTHFCLVSLSLSGAMNEDGGLTDAPSVVNLWETCALTGSHNGLGPCTNHVPCDCATPGVKHVRFHPQCTHCDPIKQRSEVWPALTGGGS
jgi:hypothetical protein